MKLQIGLAIMLMVGTSALAQQTNNPTAPTNPANPHTDPIQNQVECWDTTANRVRNSATVGQNPGMVGQNTGTGASAPQNQQAPGDASKANTRPPGMKNC
jgi:hypothetical protein